MGTTKIMKSQKNPRKRVLWWIAWAHLHSKNPKKNSKNLKKSYKKRVLLRASGIKQSEKDAMRYKVHQKWRKSL